MPTLRALARRPGFSLGVIAMFAIGIAASTAIFSIFNGLFLSALPYPAADRLVHLSEAVPSRNIKQIGISFLRVEEWRTRTNAFEHVAGYFDGVGFNLSGGGKSIRVHGSSVTFDMAATLGIRPILGRDFAPADDRTGAGNVVLLGYGLWQREFGSRADVVGQLVQLDSTPYTVIGVLPREAVFPAANDFWIPRAVFMSDQARTLNGIARLKRGVTVQQARADLLRVNAIMKPIHSVDFDPLVASLRDHYLGDYREVTEVLLGAVGVILLIACANIAAWMIARGTSRSRDFAIRAAIGASRGALIRQLLCESLWLAAIGGTAGMGIGWVALRGMLALMPDVLPAWVGFQLDARFAIFALLVTALAALISGLAPALQSSRVDVRGFLSDAKSSSSGRQSRGMNVLVVGEFALTVIVLSAAGLVLTAFHKVMSVDPGFRWSNLVTFGFDLDAKYKPAQGSEFYLNLMTRLRAIPGVESVGATDTLPFTEQRLKSYLQVEGAPLRRIEDAQQIPMRRIEPGYLRTISVAFIAGREFEERDGDNAMVVNEAFLDYYALRGTSVIGRRVGFGMGAGKEPRWFIITGVVRDVRQDGLEQPVAAAVYVPNRFVPQPATTVVIRSNVDPSAIIASARSIIHDMDPDLTMFDIQTMQERLDRSLWTRRTYSWLFGVFAGIALVMAVAGIYGVLSYTVTQRTREIGIRVALGAEPRQVLGQVLREGMAMAAVGVAIGFGGAFAATRLLQSLLAGVSPHDPWAFAAVSIVLGVAALAANLIPARRAARVDPMRALRFE
jgi:putative ABC transport system permease protein